jgi:hypothetical protein
VSVIMTQLLRFQNTGKKVIIILLPEHNILRLTTVKNFVHVSNLQFLLDLIQTKLRRADIPDHN